MPNIGIDDVVLMANHAREHKKEIHEIITISSDPIDIIEFMIENDERLINQTRYALWLYVLDRMNGNKHVNLYKKKEQWC